MFARMVSFLEQIQGPPLTEGPIVANENCKKFHYMAPTIYCCGAGTAVDTGAVTSVLLLEHVYDNMILFRISWLL